MSEISLRAYVEYIEDRLSRDAHSEVVAQCRHVLEIYPRYVEVYKLLARALLEQEQYQDALDLFQRVLSADPSDFVAHVGMSDCYRESGALDQAIWHLERAFEQAPSNIDLQEEIKRLYVERDGRAPRKIQLTAGALSRLYAKGKLYPQAILELKKALTRDPERLDLQILLADALWKNHQQVEAGKLAGEVLKRLPNSIDANRLLALLWLRADQPTEAEPFLARLRDLDPYLAYEVEHQGGRSPADAFRLMMLAYTDARHATEVGAADWVSQIRSIEKEKSVTGPLRPPSSSPDEAEDMSDSGPPSSFDESDMPDWLQEALTAGPAPSGTPQSSSPPEPPTSIDLEQLFAGQTEEPVSAPSEEPAEQPEWIRDVLLGEPPVDADEPPAGSDAGQELPAWLQGIVGEPVKPPPESSAGFAAEDAPDWLQGVLGKTAVPPTPEPAPAADEALPDWLSSAQDEVSPAPPPSAQLEPEEDREVPSWLGEILSGESQEAGVESVSEEEAAPGVVSEEWLDQIIVGAPADADASPSASESGSGEELPDWLKDIDRVTSASPQPAPSAGLGDLGTLETWDIPSQGDAVEQPLSQADDTSPQPGQPSGEALPDWLQDEAFATARLKFSVEEAPEPERKETFTGWLRGAMPDVPAPETAEPDEAQESAGDEGLPDWLQAARPPVADADGGSEEESLPDWLVSDEELSEPSAFAGVDELRSEKLDEEALLDGLQPELADEAVLSVSALQEEKQVAPPTDEPIGDEESQEIPDWLAEGDLDSDDAIAWLEELAAKYDPNFQSTVSPEAPGMSGEDEEEEEESLPAWLREEPAGPVAEAASGEGGEEEGIPDWLRAEPEKPAEPVAEVTGEEEEEAEGLPDWLRAEPERPAEPVAEVAGEEEEAEGLPDWLREEPEKLAEEKPERVFGPAQDRLPDWLKGEPVKPAADEEEMVEEAEVPAWLQEEPAEPVAEVAGEEEGEEEGLPDWLRKEPAAAGEVLDWLREPTEAAAEPVDALSWLDEQVTAQDVSPTEVVSEALTPDQPPVAPPPMPEAEGEAEPVAAEELPDWLKEPDAQAEIARAFEGPQEEEEELVAEFEVEAEEDELAWLESTLEAEEKAVGVGELADLFTEEEEREEAEMPAWLQEEPEEAPAPPSPLPAPAAAEVPPLPAPEEEEKPPIRLPGAVEEAPPITLPGPAAVSEAEIEVEAEEEELPEWLRPVGEEAPVPDARMPEPVAEVEEVEEELPEWLREPEEAEPLIEVVEEVEEEELPEVVTEPVEAPAPEAEEAVPEVAETPTAPAVEALTPDAIGDDYHELLRIAREKLNAKDVEGALPYYERLVSSSQMLEQTVADFSYAHRTEAKVTPRVRRVWGDALRAQGKLQDALEVYREALDEL